MTQIGDDWQTTQDERALRFFAETYRTYCEQNNLDPIDMASVQVSLLGYLVKELGLQGDGLERFMAQMCETIAEIVQGHKGDPTKRFLIM